MRIESFRDLLNWTSGYHRNLSHCLAHSAKKHSEERSKMLLDHLADKELQLSDIVGGFKDIAANNTLSTWCIEHVDQHPLLDNTLDDMAFAAMTNAEIITEVENLHQHLILLYQNLLGRSHPPQMQQLLVEIHDVEKSEAQQMMQGANRLEDL
jgi:hypothetical protein